MKMLNQLNNTMFLLNENKEYYERSDSQITVETKVVSSKIDYFQQHIDEIKDEIIYVENDINQLNHEIYYLEAPFMRGKSPKNNIRVNLYNKKFSKIDKGMLPVSNMNEYGSPNLQTHSNPFSNKISMDADTLRQNSSQETAHTQNIRTNIAFIPEIDRERL